MMVPAESATHASQTLSTPPPSPVSSPRIGKKLKCAFCQEKAVKTIGHCKLCEHSFCSRHRLPESHNCDKIPIMKKSSFDKTAEALMEGRTVTQKIKKDF
ncbi:hypothetical protein BC830DRAFT_1116754 [Chytriomyces sp. MP71]|nr:hypothetical protein BC830DRAFT_1116754 [Chytriomyces sp. MP71]